MGWFHSVKKPPIKKAKKQPSNTPAGLWKKCVSCGEILQASKLKDNLEVCPYCDHHYRLNARERIELLTDSGSFKEFAHDFQTKDPLVFHDKASYQERLVKAKERSGSQEGVIVGEAKIDKKPVSLAVMDFSFMGGSMGVVSGEKIALALDLAYQKKIPAIVVSCSGGARMQEGILSLMQMAKTSGAIKKLKKAAIPYISVLTDPTTGGCAASFAMLGDVNIAEPKALIGFAGPRVIEQSIRQKLPDGFQRSEFLLDHGFVDLISHRKQLKKDLSYFLTMFS
jgi:acetyl-CoA carboxylase carboxyl transferase subunit beta